MNYRIKDILLNNANIVFNYNWKTIEKENNIVFPEDYKWFLENYGVGSINDFLWVFSPICDNLNLNSFEQYKIMKNSYELMINNNLIEYEYSFYDNGIGLFPWGITDNGDELYWNYLNEGTEIVVFAARYTDIISCKLNMTDFLTGVLTQKLKYDLFPDDFALDNNYFDSIE
ncbi:SMI1/KNR4 family protein [[Clostridium] polysaccharolyticum]|uniref:SMI1-KNR4 cell-wall n=1 Tax=[Clostridium] polysaccharolyticum TaxID=29364 RepID=A0A1I0CBF3_9FIRM|nr:SMI1/KNR4 family protein [[Clostridium] polysaccharolyticum]SET16771.1 SMI1-KNR4 cell-wall [[Clostridium] polysaccharolyticum]